MPGQDAQANRAAGEQADGSSKAGKSPEPTTGGGADGSQGSPPQGERMNPPGRARVGSTAAESTYSEDASEYSEIAHANPELEKHAYFAEQFLFDEAMGQRMDPPQRKRPTGPPRGLRKGTLAKSQSEAAGMAESLAPTPPPPIPEEAEEGSGHDTSSAEGAEEQPPKRTSPENSLSPDHLRENLSPQPPLSARRSNSRPTSRATGASPLTSRVASRNSRSSPLGRLIGQDGEEGDSGGDSEDDKTGGSHNSNGSNASGKRRLSISEQKEDKVLGLLHGEGKVVYKGGNVYEGEWAKGHMEGEGSYKWIDGTQYKGSVVANALTGHGAYRWPDGAIYEGEVVGGTRHGNGVFTCVQCPSRYEGEWSEGKRHGEGTLYYDANRQTFYQGQWEHNRKHGFGVMVYSSGNTYEGEWKDDHKDGKGVMTWSTLNERYEGEWMEGKQHGHGEHVWSDIGVDGLLCQKNRYVGQWKDGKRNGRGTFYYANGTYFEGEWIDNVKQGEGKATFEDGTVYSGKFEDDRMVERLRSGASSLKEQDFLKLDLQAYLLPEGDPDKVLENVRNCFLRNNSDLRSIYKSFAKANSPNTSADECILSLGQFWHIAKFGDMLNTVFTMADVNRNVFAAVTDLKASDSPHDPAHRMLFREFLQAIVNCAQSLYTELPTLDQRLTRFVNAHVTPLMHSDVGPSPFGEFTEDCIRSHEDSLRGIYAYYSGTLRRKQKLPKYDKVMTVKEFLKYLKDTGTLETYPISNVLNLVHELGYVPQYDEAMDDLLGVEITYPEFLELLIRLVISRDILRPPTPSQVEEPGEGEEGEGGEDVEVGEGGVPVLGIPGKGGEDGGVLHSPSSVASDPHNALSQGTQGTKQSQAASMHDGEKSEKTQTDTQRDNTAATGKDRGTASPNRSSAATPPSRAPSRGETILTTRTNMSKSRDGGRSPFATRGKKKEVIQRKVLTHKMDSLIRANEIEDSVLAQTLDNLLSKEMFPKFDWKKVEWDITHE